MNRHIPLTAAIAAGGGLLAAAFLQAAAAVAAPGADAFTIDGTTFDPMTASGAEGFDPVTALNNSPPLLTLGGGQLSFLGGTPTYFAPQSFDVYSGTGSSATDLGSINTGETVANLLGMPDTEFTVTGVTPAAGVEASKLPATGTVYDVVRLGSSSNVYNVYTAAPGTDGKVTDTLVTRFGNVNLDSLFNHINGANPLLPGDAFAAVNAGDTSMPDAFTLGSITFDPMTSGANPVEGFNPVDPLANLSPLLSLGGGTLYGDAGGNPPPLGGFLSLAPQDFNVYSGSTDIGSITTGADVTNLLGLTNTEFTVSSVTAAAGDTSTQTGLLPQVGAVYDAFALGKDYTNIYSATPTVGSTPGTVTDTLVTPFGHVNLDSMFAGINAANPLDPSAAFTGLLTGSSSMPKAFALGGYTFDPMTNLSTPTEGFNLVHALLGTPPLLDIGGGTVTLGTSSLPIDTQDFNVYSPSGTEVASIVGNEDNVSTLLGLHNTEFTVASVTPTGVDAPKLPTVGTAYDVLNFGHGYENIYIATPGTDGTVQDMLMTPLGNVDLSSVFESFNAANALDPGVAVNGLDMATSAAAATDPLAFLDVAGSAAAAAASDPLAFLGL